jgi:hypothetical protein
MADGLVKAASRGIRIGRDNFSTCRLAEEWSRDMEGLCMGMGGMFGGDLGIESAWTVYNFLRKEMSGSAENESSLH